MISQQTIIDSLPSHLRPFVAHQDASRYSPRDHAVWRFLMAELSSNLSETAHPVYLEGLKRTGINLEQIPSIEEMNQCLSDIGWRAVVVDGFVPPAIFMEFQALKVLVIAVDMRTIEHMLYTPAPDIVHESAGHAPFIVDTDYAEYLQQFGELGMRAIASEADMAVYEAIRHLSIVKENPTSSSADIQSAEAALTAASEANTIPSEAALLARLHWWTVEYGLVGTLDDYRIFGAGLLSSLGESVNCLNDERVKKLPLTVDAINSTYDITNEQTRLFVAKDCRHLSQVLGEFGRNMCVNKGGASSIKKAIDAGTVNSAVYVSGLEVSGKFAAMREDAVGNVTYINTQGPTQLAYNGEQLPGHGVDFHRSGFGSPVGRLQSMNRCLSSYSIDELKMHNIALDQTVTLVFLSGVKVLGVLKNILRQDQKNVVFTFENCTVTDQLGEVLFDPAWGIYDMAVGDSIVSVYGGSADQRAYPLYEEPTGSPSSELAAESELDSNSLALMPYYRQVRELRDGENDSQSLTEVIAAVNDNSDVDWLLNFELLELAVDFGLSADCCNGLEAKLRERESSKACAEDESRLIRYGLNRLAVRGYTSSLSN